MKVRTEMEKTVDYYMSLPYTLIVRHLDDGSYYGEIKEFDGCMIGGDTWEEFGQNVELVKRMWIESLLEHGQIVPEPEPVHA